MTDRDDLRELVGDEVSEEELAGLERVDALLRSVPAPPAEVPASLTSAVRAATPTPIWTRRRVATALALAAALSALFLGFGAWLGNGSDFESRASIRLEPTADARGASGLIRVGPSDRDGNWTLELRTEGLPRLPKGGYYLLWLARKGQFAGPCGTFRAGPGETTIRWNVSYKLGEYDRWVISAVRPGDEEFDKPWLLQAPVGTRA